MSSRQEEREFKEQREFRDSDAEICLQLTLVVNRSPCNKQPAQVRESVEKEREKKRERQRDQERDKERSQSKRM